MYYQCDDRLFLSCLYRRKQHARRSRQQRQPTQPVDNEIVKRLMAQDKLKEDKLKEVRPPNMTTPPHIPVCVCVCVGGEE